MIAYDIDGTIDKLEELEPGSIVISGRTFAEYDETCKELAKNMPVYIRGSGNYGDRIHAGNFKALMIKMLEVDKYYEDDKIQIAIIKKLNPDVEIVKV